MEGRNSRFHSDGLVAMHVERHPVDGDLGTRSSRKNASSLQVVGTYLLELSHVLWTREDGKNKGSFLVGFPILDELDVGILRSDIFKIVDHAVMRSESVSWFVAEKLLWSLELG